MMIIEPNLYRSMNKVNDKIINDDIYMKRCCKPFNHHKLTFSPPHVFIVQFINTENKFSKRLS